MTTLQKGLVLAGLQCAMVLSLTGKLLYDRATCPPVWVQTERWDPNLPLRGRYLSLRLLPQAGAQYNDRLDHQNVLFFVPERSLPFEKDLFTRNGPDLWVEVTIPHAGPPRPIRLGIKKDGQIQPLQVN